MAASAHWPSPTAPAAATSISTLMSSESRRAARQALRTVSEPPAATDVAKTARESSAGAPSASGEQPGEERGARDPDERLAPPPRGVGAGSDRLLVLEPRAHAGVGDGVRDRGRRQLRRVVLHVEALPHQVGGEILEAGEVPEPPLDHRDLLAAVHPFDRERGLGVELADGAGDGACGHFLLSRGARADRSSTCSRPCSKRPTMCWSSSR